MKTTIGIFCMLATALTATAALAGSVTLDNSNGPCAMKVRVDSYVFGIPTTEYLCAGQKETKYLGNALSIGMIYVDPAGEGGCANFSKTFNIAHPYKVPGTWLPHRGFKVVVNSSGKYTVSE